MHPIWWRVCIVLYLTKGFVQDASEASDMSKWCPSLKSSLFKDHLEIQNMHAIQSTTSTDPTQTELSYIHQACENEIDFVLHVVNLFLHTGLKN